MSGYFGRDMGSDRSAENLRGFFFTSKRWSMRPLLTAIPLSQQGRQPCGTFLGAAGGDWRLAEDYGPCAQRESRHDCIERKGTGDSVSVRCRVAIKLALT